MGDRAGRTFYRKAVSVSVFYRTLTRGGCVRMHLSAGLSVAVKVPCLACKGISQ